MPTARYNVDKTSKPGPDAATDINFWLQRRITDSVERTLTP